MSEQWMLSASLIVMLGAAVAAAEDTQSPSGVGKTPIAGTKKYQLRYKCAPGDVIRSKIIHQAAVNHSAAVRASTRG